jgi:hypothetical protein
MGFRQEEVYSESSDVKFHESIGELSGLLKRVIRRASVSLSAGTVF